MVRICIFSVLVISATDGRVGSVTLIQKNEIGELISNYDWIRYVQYHNNYPRKDMNRSLHPTGYMLQSGVHWHFLPLYSSQFRKIKTVKSKPVWGGTCPIRMSFHSQIPADTCDVFCYPHDIDFFKQLVITYEWLIKIFIASFNSFNFPTLIL